MSALFVELIERQRDSWELRLWRENPNDAKTRALALSEIDDLVAKSETDYYVGPADVTIGQRLFRWLDGPERVLSRAIADAGHGDGPLVLAISCRDRLAHLPWETLADDDGFLVERENPPVVPARWNGKTSPPWPERKNRPLRTLFMAAAPESGGAPLQYEQEEALMLRAATVRDQRQMDLVVEESGCLGDLKGLVDAYEPDYFDVFHLTGHAGHKNGEPVFYLETEIGEPDPVTATQLARTFTGRAPLVGFLSGCQTAQNPGGGGEQSMAEHLIGLGFRLVLGWGRPVRDDHANLAAECFYHALARGDSLCAALSQTWRTMLQKNADNWHLLRLHFAGGVPGASVTAPMTRGRVRFDVRRPSESFLIPGKNETKIAGPLDFVGRRRVLQRGVRQLRVGNLILHGTGGLGKSSVAGRLCDRLKDDFHIVAVFGRCDEFALVNALVALLAGDSESSRALRGGDDLFDRLVAALAKLAVSAGDKPNKPVLFVLDDFEQNQELPRDGEPFGALKPEIAATLEALTRAVEHDGGARILVTTRYDLAQSLIPGALHESLTPMDSVDESKRLARFQGERYRVAASRPDDLRERARVAAAGNHRLLGWLFDVLNRNDAALDHDALIKAMEEKEAEFREEILAERLCAALPKTARALLTALQVCKIPIPFEAVAALEPERLAASVRADLDLAVAWGLAYIWTSHGQPDLWSCPELLAPILGDAPNDAPARVFPVLKTLWWDTPIPITEERSLELHRLALAIGENDFALNLARRLCGQWMDRHRAAETVALAETTLAATNVRDPNLLTSLARAYATLGDGARARACHEEAASLQADREMDDEKAASLFHQAGLLIQQGKNEVAEVIYRDQLIPFYTSKGEAGIREVAVTQGRIADILVSRGELDEALRIRQEEELPVYRRLQDVRSIAVTQGKIADILVSRGELDEALRIRREEELPVYRRLQDVRSLIVCRAMLAQMLMMRGKVQEDGLEVMTHLAWAWRAATRMRLPEAGQIEELAAQIGLPMTMLQQVASSLPE